VSQVVSREKQTSLESIHHFQYLGSFAKLGTKKSLLISKSQSCSRAFVSKMQTIFLSLRSFFFSFAAIRNISENI